MVNKYYPVALDIKSRPVTVIGGGKVAERKIFGLLGAGADIRVISPDLTSGLKRLEMSKRIKWIRRKVRKDDLRKTRIIIAATDDAGVNKNISKWARKKEAWVNVVDQPVLSDFISTAILRKDKALLSVYTDGRDPVLSRDLKNFLREHWDVFLSYRDRL